MARKKTDEPATEPVVVDGEYQGLDSAEMGVETDALTDQATLPDRQLAEFEKRFCAPDLPGVASSLSLSTVDGRMRLFNAMGGADLTLNENGTIELDVQHWVVHETTIPSREDGELVQTIRVALLTPDGHVFECFSPIVADRLRQLLAILPDGEWPGVLRLSITEVSSKRRKGIYYYLRVVTGD